ncbi:hypothetical protein II906_10795 [bacterium]|nr:hypothetical protein [bacterium]
MAFLFWLWDFISPILFFFSLYYIVKEDTDYSDLITIFSLGGVFFVIGLFIGVVRWKYDVPPNWYWRKSSVELAGSKIGTCIGSGISFFFLPAAIAQIISLL